MVYTGIGELSFSVLDCALRLAVELAFTGRVLCCSAMLPLLLPTSGNPAILAAPERVVGAMVALHAQATPDEQPTTCVHYTRYERPIEERGRNYVSLIN